MHRCILYSLIVFLLVGSGVSVAAQESINYTRLDVQIVLQEDGNFTVQEFHHLRFNGRFTQGFAEISLDYLNEVRGITVAGGPDEERLVAYELAGLGPESYTFEFEDNSAYVNWEYAPTRAGDEMVFVVAYEVVGGLWVYEEMVTLEWQAVVADRSGLAIPASRVTVDLPLAVTAEQLGTLAIGADYTTTIEPLATGQRVIFEASEAIPDGTSFQVVVDFPPGLVAAERQPWQVEEESRLAYRVDRLDIEMVVAEDGRLHLTENQQVTVEAGLMDEGFRDINLLFIDEISNVELSEGEQKFQLSEAELCPYCYRLERTPRQPRWLFYNAAADEVGVDETLAGDVSLVWAFPGLVRGESTTFTLAYEVEGVFSLEEDGYRLSWSVGPGQAVIPQEVNVMLQLPPGLGLEDVRFEGAVVERTGEGRLQLTPENEGQSGQPWRFDLMLPPGTINPTKPAWQSEFEAMLARAEIVRAESARRAAQRQLAIQAGGIGVGITAVLGLITGWYLWGSRKVREVMGQYRTMPPNDLAPGIVAYLFDNKATGKGGLASLFYLAGLGLIRLKLANQLRLERRHEGQVAAGQKFTTPTGDKIKIPGHAALLFNKLHDDLPQAQAVPFETIQATFQQALPSMYAAMAQEMVAFFYGNSDNAWRRRLIRFSPFLFFLVAVVIATFVTPFLTMGTFLSNAAFIFGFILLLFLRRKFRGARKSLTRLGEEEVKKWQGFKAYLQDIQKYGDLAEAQEILDRYFAYAVALGVEESLLAQVGDLGGYAPVWVGDGTLSDGSSWRNRPYERKLHHRPWYRRGAWLPTRRPVRQPRPQGDNGRPALQSISDNLTRSLDEASSKMTTLLNTAVGEGKAEPLTIRAAGQSKEVIWQPGSSINQVVGEIMKESQSIRPSSSVSSGSRGGWSGRSGGGFRSSGGSGGVRSRGSSSRSSSSRRSGGSGRRGFK